jgi:Ca-activated chloride channel family protein
MRIESGAGLIAVRGEPIPLEKVEIEGEVSGAYARVRLNQRYRNAESRPIEAIYTFPLPADATLVAFTLVSAGRRIESVVREREQAFREYDEAINSGHGAALIDQERPNVFTAQIGNLLPNEESVVELEYLQRVSIDEGTLRWMIPTLVAPRYIPGKTMGYRTAHGRADPTDQVPDADRISPPIGTPDYRLRIKLLFDLGEGVQVESPSHRIQIARADQRLRVTLEQSEVALDRDLILTVRGAEGAALCTVASHRDDQKPGFFALSVVPDLFEVSGPAKPQDVFFLLDTSGSMAGASITEARAALRLCLRQLREGDRFNAIAFNDRQLRFSAEPVPFTQKTLNEADRWIDLLQADGGTQLLPALMLALKSRPEVLMLLTDGQVGNENEILAEVARAATLTRIYSFGIGTNVSDPLLRDLSRETAGAVELIHPGERIDDKVVSQFAKAIAPRVSNVSVSFHGVEVRELAPEKAAPLVEGEAWVLFGRYSSPGRGHLELRGSRNGEPFLMKIPIELSEEASRPYLAKLWAAERIRDLEASRVSGRRGDAIRKRILELALEQGIASPYTSFVAIEERSGDRLATGQPQTRVVPVHPPAGWKSTPIPVMRALFAAPLAMRASKRMPLQVARMGPGMTAKAPAPFVSAGFNVPMADSVSEYSAEGPPALDSVAAILARQLASGLWGAEGGVAGPSQVKATAFALLDLFNAAITSSDPRHGPQVRKAIQALLKLARQGIDDPRALELALGVAWLCATGPRTRAQVDELLSRAAIALPPRDDGGQAIRRHVKALASALR